MIWEHLSANWCICLCEIPFLMSFSTSWKTFWIAMVIQLALIVTMKMSLCLLWIMRCYIYIYIYIYIYMVYNPYIYIYIQVTQLKQRNQTVLFLCFICLSVQEINSDSKENRLNFILLGCLIPFKEEICNLFAIEKSKFLANKWFFAVFNNTLLQQAFKNRQNLKQLVSRS